MSALGRKKDSVSFLDHILGARLDITCIEVVHIYVITFDVQIPVYLQLCLIIHLDKLGHIV